MPSSLPPHTCHSHSSPLPIALSSRRPVELLALDWAREAAPWISDAAIDAQIKEYEREEFDMEEIEVS